MSTGSRDEKDKDSNKKANEGTNQPTSSKSPSSSARHPDSNSSAEESRSEQTQALDLRKKNNSSVTPSASTGLLLILPSNPISPVSAHPNAAAPDLKYCEWCKKPVRPGLCGNNNFCKDTCFESYRRCHYKRRACCAICGQRGDWDAGDSGLINGSLEDLPERVCRVCHFQKSKVVMDHGQGESPFSVGSPVPSTSGMSGRAGDRSTTSASVPPLSITSGSSGLQRSRSIIHLASAPTPAISLEHLAQIQHIQNLPYEFRPGSRSIQNSHHTPTMQSISNANNMSPSSSSPSVAATQHAARTHAANGLVRIQHASLHSVAASHAVSARIQPTVGRPSRLPPPAYHRSYQPTTSQSGTSQNHEWYLGRSSCPLDPIPNLLSPIHSPRQKGTSFCAGSPPDILYRPAAPSPPESRYRPTTPSPDTRYRPAALSPDVVRYRPAALSPDSRYRPAASSPENRYRSATPSPDNRYCLGTPPSEVHYHPKTPESPCYMVTPCRKSSPYSATSNIVSSSTSQGHPGLSPTPSGLQPRMPPPTGDERNIVSQGPPPPPSTPNYSHPLSVQIPQSSGGLRPMASPERHCAKRPRMDGGIGSRPNTAMHPTTPHHISGRDFAPNSFYTQGMSGPWHHPGLSSNNPFSPKLSYNGTNSSGSSSVGSNEILPSPPNSRLVAIARHPNVEHLTQESIPRQSPLPMAPPVSVANYNNFAGIFNQRAEASTKQEYMPIEGMGSVTRGGRGRGKGVTKGRGRGRGAANGYYGKPVVATSEMGTSVTEDLGVQEPLTTRSVGTSTHADASTNTSLLPPISSPQDASVDTVGVNPGTGKNSVDNLLSATGSLAAGSSAAIAHASASVSVIGAAAPEQSSPTGNNIINGDLAKKKQKHTHKKKNGENGNDEKKSKSKKDSKIKNGKKLNKDKKKEKQKSDQEKCSQENATGEQSSNVANCQSTNGVDVYMFTDESADLGAQVEISTADDAPLSNEDGMANGNHQNGEITTFVNANEDTVELNERAPEQFDD